MESELVSTAGRKELETIRAFGKVLAKGLLESNDFGQIELL
jgi:hypothetical protein